MSSGSPGRSAVDSKRLSTAVVEAIADAENVSPDELDPLYNTIDPEALDALFAPTGDGDRERTGRVEFRVAGYDVVATSTGRVHLTDADTGGG